MEDLIAKIKALRRENQELRQEIADLKARITRMIAKYKAIQDKKVNEVDILSKLMGMR